MPRPKKEQPNHAGGLYEVKITVGKTMEGKLIRKSYYSSISKEDARKQAEEWKVEREVANRTGNIFVADEVTFEHWAKVWLEQYKKGEVKDQTFRDTYAVTVTKNLIPFFGAAKLNDIRPVDIKRFYNELAEKYSRSKLDKAKICLNALFEAAIDNDLCYKNPAKKIAIPETKNSTEKRCYSQSQSDQLLEYAKRQPDGLPIVLLLKFGLRRGELLGLMWSDIDLNNKCIHIKRAVSLKNHKPVIGAPKSEKSVRDLPMDDDIFQYLSAVLENHNNTYIVTDRRGAVMDPSNWSARNYDKFMREFGMAYPDIPILNPHELRHTCGILLYRKTKNIYAVSKFLGHADVKITADIYVHNDLDALRNDLKM